MIPIAETKAVEEKMPSGRQKWCHSNDDEPDYAVQRFNMLFEHRRPKKGSISTTIFATRMVTRHIKRNEDPASPSYISHAARRRDHLYRREDAPLARRQLRCLPAAEAAGSLFYFYCYYFLYVHHALPIRIYARAARVQTF